MSVKIQIKRANASAWTAANPTLAAGEWGMELDTKKLKLGTGALWNSTDYYSETLTLNSVGDVTITSLQNGDFLRYSSSASAWINDPVNLSTDTVGDYVQSLTAGTGVTLSNNSGEGATPTVAIGQAVGTSASVTFGQLTVNGQTNVGGNIIPNTNEAYDLGSASARFRDIYLSGTTINLGGAEITSDGTDISFSGAIGVSGSANFVGDLTGNADTATTLETSRAISLAGDLSGSASFDGSTNVTITATVQPNSVALVTDTTGNYVNDVVSGTGVTVTHAPGEGSSASIAIGQDVATSASVQFAKVTAPLDGNASTASTLQTPRTIALTGDVSGSVSFNGASDVSISATVQPNSVSLGTDTTGNYVNDVTAGTGVTITHTPGEGSSPTIAIGQAVGTSSSVQFAAVTAPLVGNVTGNADTATALQTARVIALSGDVSGSVSFNGTGNVDISTTIGANSVSLGSDTSGDYVSSLVAGTGVSLANNSGETATPTISIGQDVATSASVTFAKVDTTGDVTVGGNLTVNGTTTTLNTETLSVEDNIVVLNSNATGSPALNAGLEVERGDSANVVLRWNESTDKWETTNDGSAYSVIATNGNIALGTDTTGNYMSDVTASTGVTISHTTGEGSTATFSIGQPVGTSASVTFAAVSAPLIGNVTGDVSGNSGTATALQNSRVISIGGDVSGSVSFNGTSDVTISAEIQPNSVALGTDTTGNFVNDVTAGTGVSVTHTPGEGSSPTIAIGQAVSTSSSVTFGHVSAPVTGNVTGNLTGNADTAATLQTPRTISLSGDVSGSVSFNGSANVDISATVQPNSVALGTDTTGNYMSDLTQGTGVSITHTPGEGSNATIAIGQAVGTSSSVQFAAVTAPLIGNASTATTLENARTISLGGDVSGSVSFNGSSDVSISATIQPNSVGLGTDTSGDYVSSLVAGTGVTLTNNSGETATPTVAIGQDVATSASVTFASVNAPVSGNATTASTLQNSRTISLSGDVSGSVSFNGSSNVDIATTVQPNSVALGTDTTGNYVNDLTAGTGVTVTHTPGEGSSPTVAIGQSVATSASVTFAQVDTTGDVTVGGNLTVNGTTTTLNTETLAIEDNIVVLNSNVTGSPTTNAGIEIERGTSANVSVRWNESTDSWELTEDGSTYKNIAVGQDVETSASVQFVAVTAELVGNSSTSSALKTPRTIALSGDVSGSVSFDGSANVDITATIQPNSIGLGTDTTGDFVSSLVAGTGVTLTNNAGESATPTIAIGQAVGTSSSVQFAAVTAPLIGNVTGNADTATSLATSRTIELTGDVTGSVSFNGSANASIAATIQPNSVSLGTDTTGNYVNDLTGGTGVTITHTPGEGSSPTVAIGQSVATSASVTFASVTAPLIGNVTGDVTGSSGSTTGNAATATALQSARSISLTGDVSGSVSFNGTSDVSISATIQPNSVALGTDTTGNYVNDLTAGTGVTVTHTPGEGTSPTVAIGQAVGTSSSVTFAAVTAPLVGNASTATALQTARNIAGQSFDGSANISIAPTDLTGVTSTAAEINILDGATLSTTELNYVDGVTSAIQTQIDTKAPSASPTFTGVVTLPDNTVALGTKTTGDYVSSLVAGTGVTLTNNSGETATPTIAIGQSVATSASVTFEKVDTTGDVTVGGNLTVNGTTTTLNTETLAIEDNIVVLNSNVTGSPTTNAGIEVERGTSSNVSVRWNETSDKWEITEDGSTYLQIATASDVSAVAIDSLDEITDVTITSAASGQFLKWNGSAWVNDAIDLGTDTTGNYMSGITAGTGLTVSHTPGEGSSASVSLNATLDNLSNVTAPSPSDGQFLKYVSASSAWVPAEVPTINALDDIGNVNAPTPTDGQVLKYVSASSAWVAETIIGGATISDTAPASPLAGQLWYESDTGKTFVYYDSFWVEIIGSAGAQGPTGPTGATGPTGPTGPAVTALDDIGNVIAPSPADGNFLKYVSASSSWVPAVIPTINALDDIGNVIAPSPADGNFLKYVSASAAWVPAAAVAAPKIYVEEYTDVVNDTEWTCPAGVTQVKLTLIGAGGAAGDVEAITSNSSTSQGFPADTSGSTTFTVGGTTYAALGGKKGTNVSITGPIFTETGTNFYNTSSSSSSGSGTSASFSRYPGCGGAPGNASAETYLSFTDNTDTFDHTSKAKANGYPGQDGVIEVFQVTVAPSTTYSFSIGQGAGFVGTTESYMGSSGAVIIEYIA